MDFLSEKARRLTPYVAGIQPREAGWIKLNTNENPYPPSPKVAEALRGADFSCLRLYPDGDSGELRAAIADTYNVETQNIFCANSSDEVLALAFQAFFSGKKNVLSPDISYGFYPVWGEMYDVGMKFVPVCKKDFSISAADYTGANGVIIANPNAPTSLALRLSDIEKIVAQNSTGKTNRPVEKNSPENCVVIIDEAYIAFADKPENASAVELTHKYENLLVTRTFSKSHSLAGLRVGYAIGNPALIDGLCRVRDAFNSYPLDMLAQIGAAAAIADTQYLRETVSRVIATREKTSNRLREMGYNVLPSQANFIFMEAANAAALYGHLHESKILVRYWKNIKNYLRVSIGTEEEMEAFAKCVERYGGA